MGKWVLDDLAPIEAAAQTIYHELTHKVRESKDHACGKVKCRRFSATDQSKALTNADSRTFYAISVIKPI